MTNREFYLSIINGTVSAETVDKAQELLSALDARNEKRKGAETKDKREAAARRDAVLKFLKEHEGAFTRDQISVRLDMDAAKVSGACTALIKGGLVTKSEIKVDKARKVAYSIA
ncbi:hypothetical protein II906_07370 [bacterium]|nr:hypothetical protein [bacterium]